MIAIVGVVGAAGFLLLPRDRIAVSQATQIVARAVQYARFEAVKEDRPVQMTFENGAAVVRPVGASGGATTFALDPTGSHGIVATAATGWPVVFNGRGVATAADGGPLPSPASVTIQRATGGASRRVEVNMTGNVEIR